MLSMHDNTMIIEKAMKAGADGYILKNDLSDDLLNAVEKVMNNETIISASVDVNEFKDSFEETSRSNSSKSPVTASNSDLQPLSLSMSVLSGCL